MQKPTIGRILWFWKEKPANEHVQPQAAMITAVWGDRCINVSIWGENGVPESHPPTSVTLVQDGDEPPPFCYCTWPCGQGYRHAHAPAAT